MPMGSASNAVGNGPKLAPAPCSIQVTRITSMVPNAMVSPCAKFENRRTP